MLITKETSKKNIYTKNIENMGEHLALISIENMKPSLIPKFHLFYGDNKKPPMDIAIYPEDKGDYYRYNHIEYITYFIQNEIIKKSVQIPDITYINKSLLISSNNFSENNYSISYFKKFNNYYYNNSLYIIDNEIHKVIYAYYLGSKGYILTNNQKNIIGFIYPNLSVDEIEMLQKIKVLGFPK